MVQIMDEEILKEEFMQLTTEKIIEIIKAKGFPKVGVVIPDGTRRWGILFHGMNPDFKDFEENLIKKLNNLIIEKTKIIFNYGIETLFMPGVTHGNFLRTNQYVDTVTNIGLKNAFKDKSWLDFYNEFDIKVKIYGDLEFVKKMGFKHIIKWVKEIEELTKENQSHTLYHGLACSNSYENMRIIDMAINFFKEHKRNPSKEELIELYYGEMIEEVDFFIRPTVMRDSDIQPPLISGRKTQLYFPISPILNFTEKMFREILYDILFSRVITMSKKQWKKENLNKNQIQYLKKYYEINGSSIIGIGKKVGNLWIPLPQVKMKSLK